MATHYLHEKLELPVSLEEAWDFLSSPENLGTITPPQLGFEIRSPYLPEKIYPGLMIAYWVKPFLGIRMGWLSEITHVREPFYFVDEQRAGPYALWHHEHWLSPTERGVLMTDRVSYRLPAGPLGDLAHHLFIRKQLEGIFQYRARSLEKHFNRP